MLITLHCARAGHHFALEPIVDFSSCLRRPKKLPPDIHAPPAYRIGQLHPNNVLMEGGLPSERQRYESIVFAVGGDACHMGCVKALPRLAGKSTIVDGPRNGKTTPKQNKARDKKQSGRGAQT